MRVRLLALPLLLAALAPAQVSQSSGGYLLRMKWAKGDNFKYSVATTTETSTGTKVPLAMEYSIKVDSVVNGVANVTITSTSPMIQQPSVLKSKMDGRGEVEEKGKTGALRFPRLPEKPVKVGSSWTNEVTTPTGAGTIKVKSTYTFKGVQTVDKISCAIITVSSSSTGDFASTTTGTMYVQVSNGQLFKSDSKSVVTLTQNGKKQTLKTDVTVRRK